MFWWIFCRGRHYIVVVTPRKVGCSFATEHKLAVPANHYRPRIHTHNIGPQVQSSPHNLGEMVAAFKLIGRQGFVFLRPLQAQYFTFELKSLSRRIKLSTSNKNPKHAPHQRKTKQTKINNRSSITTATTTNNNAPSPKIGHCKP